MHGSQACLAKDIPSLYMRTLAQEGRTTVVTTPEELLTAFEAGSTHIEITAHMDLTTIEPNHVDYEDTEDEYPILFGHLNHTDMVITVCTPPAVILQL